VRFDISAAKLDGIKKSNKSKESLTMDDWLGLEELNDAPLEPGKKRVSTNQHCSKYYFLSAWISPSL
jgi:hypothetical protein